MEQEITLKQEGIEEEGQRSGQHTDVEDQDEE